MTGSPDADYAGNMLDYAEQRAREVMCQVHKAVLASDGPAGLQASEFPCEAHNLLLYFLIPKTSDHLFNLEHVKNVTVVTDAWEVQGEAALVSANAGYPCLVLIKDPLFEWYQLVKVTPDRLQIRSDRGWGYIETIDLERRTDISGLE